jgi:hypothetical protein
LSLGGRLVLIKAILSAIPIYWMILFRLPSKVKIKIDNLCRKFLWFGGNPTRKKYYCLVAWKSVCRSYNQDGLGIINLKLMNKVLLCKWLWRLNNPMEKGL